MVYLRRSIANALLNLSRSAVEPRITEFNIRPNASYPRRNWRWLLLILVVLSLGIAVRFAVLGFWMILPFTVIELAILILLMELVRRRGSYTETVRIGDEQVEILHQEQGNDRDWSFPLYWTRVDLRRPRHRWYPHRLLVGSAGTWIEIGSCLTDDERASLGADLRRELRRHKEQVPNHA